VGQARRDGQVRGERGNEYDGVVDHRYEARGESHRGDEEGEPGDEVHSDAKHQCREV
jgi:hypothetical protein